MTNIICIAYQPGAFGSFVGWTIDRFSASRKQFQPPVINDPLLKDGSSHSYASFCRVDRNSDFIERLYDARRSDTTYGYQIHAGWPQGSDEDLLWSINRVANNMSTYDKMFIVECLKPSDHFLRYLRNERTLDRDRWYAMIDVKNDDDLLKRLIHDVESEPIPKDYQHSKLCRIAVSEIIEGDANALFDKIFGHLGSATCDTDLYVSTITRMRSMQEPFLERIENIKAGEFDTPVEEAIHRYMIGDT